MTYNLFWGDLHSHCSVSYGEGTIQQALLRGKDQLDFCSITGHAFWPDMPQDRQRYGEIIDYHREGFARLAENWAGLLQETEAHSVSGGFLVLPSYEWHSLEYGDHNVYAAGPELELHDAPDLASLRRWAESRDAIVIPHHIGYAAGYRGIDWRHFRETASPFVEIFSLHGCSESEEAPYPMLHDMGPRDFGSTAAAGWQAGHKFGVIASTDHHGGYPGSHGDGRIGVFAESLTRDALWQAFKARRVFAVTGDKIDARLLVNDAWCGSQIRSPGVRRLVVDVQGSASLACAEVLKNDHVRWRLFPEPQRPFEGRSARGRLRVTWGWGRKDEPVAWQLQLRLSAGSIVGVETCFSGQSIVAPPGVSGHRVNADHEERPHQVLEQAAHSLDWRSVTIGNPSTRHSTTQSLSLDLDAPLDAEVAMTVNGISIRHALATLLNRGHVTYLRGWLSEAIRIGPFEPQSDCTLHAELDDEPETECDRYRLRVRQNNGQWAWGSPIWVDR